MKKLAVSAFAIVIVGINLVSIPVSGKIQRETITVTETQRLIATPNGQALVKLPRIPKPKVFRSNPLRKSQILSGTDPYNAVDDEDYIFARNRNKIEVKKFNSSGNDEELSEHVRWRLFLARQLALLKYREVHG